MPTLLCELLSHNAARNGICVFNNVKKKKGNKMWEFCSSNLSIQTTFNPFSNLNVFLLFIFFFAIIYEGKKNYLDQI